MRETELESVEEFFKPILDDFEEIVKSVFIYGSAVRKERVEGSDIDALIIIDDNSEKFEEKKLQEVREEVSKIKQKADDEGYDLHIQPPKKVSNWVGLLLEGRPWAITSIRYSESIYDPDRFQSTLQSLINSTPPKSKEERSRKLKEEAEDDLNSANDLIEEFYGEIIENCYETGKAYLNFHEEVPSSKKEMINIFEEKEVNISFLNEMKTDYNNLEGRNLKFEDLDNYKDDAIEFVKNTQNQLEKDIETFREDLINQTFQEAKEGCRLLLDDLNVDYNEENIFEQFKKEIIDKNVLEKEYWKFIQDIKKKKEGSEKNFLYEPLINLRDFETAINNVIDSEFFENFEMKDNSENSRLTPINEYEEEILEEYQEIKGIYVITFEHLMNTEDSTVVILIDDTSEIKTEEVKKYADKLENDVGEEHGFNIHTKIRSLTNYWEMTQKGNEELVYEVKTSIISYDPQGLLSSMEQLIEEGKISGTVPQISSEIEDAQLKLIVPASKIKRKALEKYYSASIKLGQCILLKENKTPPVQKHVPKILSNEEIRNTEITEKEIETIENTIKTYKQMEYGNIDQLDGRKLDKIRKNLQKLSKKC